MPEDYARKHYDDRSYPDWMRTMPAKAMWNQILEANPGVGEYASKIRSTPLSRSIQRYIEQSNFKKPYKDHDFVNMEGDWEGPGRGTEYRPGTYDNPWNIRYPQISQADPEAGLPDSVSGCTLVFDAECGDCYCNNQTMDITVTGTWPINALTLTLFAVGTTLAVLDGLGTNTVTAELTTTDNQSGYVTIEASMTAYCDGKAFPGDSNVNVFACRECCPEECDLEVNTGVTPDTMGQSDSVTVAVSGGTAPYTWSLTQPDGSGFTIDTSITNSTTLYTAVDACGSADLNVIDSCGCEVDFNVKCTTGGWSAAQNGPAYCTGCGGPPYCSDSRDSGWVVVTGWQKVCTQAACKYQFTERVQQTLSTSYGGFASMGECEAAREGRSCRTFPDCTFYGFGGMACGECVGHRLFYDYCGAAGLGNADVLRIPLAQYYSATCNLSGGFYTYCQRCVPSVSLSRKKWGC